MTTEQQTALAQILATAAVSGDRAPLTKVAIDFGGMKDTLTGALSNPMARNALMGAAGGGLLGLTAGKDKKRKALYYALLGGLGGAGLTAGAQGISAATEPPPPSVSAPIRSRLTSAAKGVGLGLGAAGAAAGAGLLGTQLRRLNAHVGRGRMGPVARQALRSYGSMPVSAQAGIPAAGAGLAWLLMNRGRVI